MYEKLPKKFFLKKQSVAEVAREAAKSLRAGGVLVYPTDTIYGLGADPRQPQVVERVYRLKGRDFSKPIHMIIGAVELLEAWVEEITPAAEKLMATFWPGPLTLIFQARSTVQGRFLSADHTVGIRFPKHAFCQRLSLELQAPVLSTSANRSGEVNPLRVEDVPPEILRAVNIVVDGGPAGKSLPSTIVSVVHEPVRLVRAGALPVEQIEAVVGKIDIVAEK